MPKTKSQKADAIAALHDKLQKAQGVFVVAPKSINPNEAAELKIKLAEVGGEYNLIKNTLFKKALEQLGFETDANFEVGQNAIVFVGDKTPEAAKILATFAKETEKAEFKGGYLETKKISAADVQALAELPSRDQLLANVLATMNAPISGFVNVLAANIRGIVTVIDAYKNTKS